MSDTHYLDNNRLEALIKIYKRNPAHNEELMQLFDRLITTIMESFGFEVEKDDAKQECFLLVLKTLKNFDPDSGSAFNYFTTVIVNNLRLIYSKNKKTYTKHQDYVSWKKDILNDI